MITRQVHSQILTGKEEMTVASTALINKCSELGISVSNDLETLKQSYKTKLFNDVLSKDKGLKLRYDLHKTDKAKEEIVNSTISLEGYEEIQELEQLIENYEIAFGNTMYEMRSSHGLQSGDFLTQFNGDMDAYFTGKVIDVVNTQMYKDLKVTADTLNKMYDTGVLSEYAFINGFYTELSKFLPASTFNKEVTVNEAMVYHCLMAKK